MVGCAPARGQVDMSSEGLQSIIQSWETVRFELLNTPISFLGLEIEGSPLEPCTQRLLREMAAKRIAFQPSFYLTDGWGCPDRVPVIGIPFYLADRRLRADRGGADRRGRGRQDGDDVPPPRGGARGELRLPAVAAARLGAAVRRLHEALPRRRSAPTSSAAGSCGTSTPTGTAGPTPRSTPTRTSPRPSPSGSRPARAGARATGPGPRSRSSSSSTG